MSIEKKILLLKNVLNAKKDSNLEESRFDLVVIGEDVVAYSDFTSDTYLFLVNLLDEISNDIKAKEITNKELLCLIELLSTTKDFSQGVDMMSTFNDYDYLFLKTEQIILPKINKDFLSKKENLKLLSKALSFSSLVMQSAEYPDLFSIYIKGNNNIFKDILKFNTQQVNYYPFMRNKTQIDYLLTNKMRESFLNIDFNDCYLSKIMNYIKDILEDLVDDNHSITTIDLFDYGNYINQMRTNNDEEIGIVDDIELFFMRFIECFTLEKDVLILRKKESHLLNENIYQIFLMILKKCEIENTSLSFLIEMDGVRYPIDKELSLEETKMYFKNYRLKRAIKKHKEEYGLYIKKQWNKITELNEKEISAFEVSNILNGALKRGLNPFDFFYFFLYDKDNKKFINSKEKDITTEGYEYYELLLRK